MVLFSVNLVSCQSRKMKRIIAEVKRKMAPRKMIFIVSIMSPYS